MANSRFSPKRFCGRELLLLTGTLLLASGLTGQTVPVPGPEDATMSTQLPADVQARLNKLEDALKAARTAGETKTEAKTLNQIGRVNYLTSDYPQCLENYTQGLAAARSVKEPIEEAEALNGLASCNRTQGQYQKAIGIAQQALDVATASGDLRGQAQALQGLGWANFNLDKADEALGFYNRALPLAIEAADVDLQALIVNCMGSVYDAKEDPEKALKSFNQAVELWRTAGDQRGEGSTLGNIGVLYAEQGDKLTALQYLKRALPLATAAGNRSGAAENLLNTGIVFRILGQKEKALRYYNLALPFLHAIHNTSSEAVALLNLGNLYSDLDRPQEAKDTYRRGLALSREIGSSSTEAGVLVGIGNLENVLGEEQKALEDLNRALTIWRTLQVHRGEATTLNSIGITYDDLGDGKDALEHYTQAFILYQTIGDHSGEAMELSNIAGIFSGLAEKQKALEYFNQALALYREDGDNKGVSRTLNNMGLVYSDLRDDQKALEALSEALRIRQTESGGSGGDLGSTLNNIGDIYDDLGDKPRGLEYHLKALPLAIAAADPLREALVFRSLMLNYKVNQPALAIFYGKQAVNMSQQVRANIQGMDRALQSSFLSSKREYYHDLADLLITRGRYPEAQQVLDLLKEQEYRDYVRGGPADTLSALTLTSAEKQAEQEYQKSTAQIVSLGEQWARLKQITQRTPEQEKAFQELTTQLDNASKGLNNYYNRLYVLFGTTTADANKQLDKVKGDVSALEDQIAETPHVVALYTMVTGDRYHVIVITAGATVAREYAIAEPDLNRKIAAFEQALRNPARDPRQIAQELYTILIGPVKADLDQAHAETLVWSLDGALRYVPMAALFDGKQYLVEKYNTVTITPESIAHLAEKPDLSNMSAAAMGISLAVEQGLPPLPAVVGELDDVVNDAQVKGANGVLPGTILLDGKFTEKAMENVLSTRLSVVHIASHFVFKPGDDSQSYLLLSGKDEGGAGYHLTVADFRDNRNLAFRNTDLLTLSACETGMSGNAGNGREVDGLGMTAQRKGAKAVISSLWSVNDASTGELMGDFYRRWAEGAGKVTKVEALREAQLDLLLGKVKAPAGASGRGFGTALAEKDVPLGYADPYFWAPFVLMGNWR